MTASKLRCGVVSRIHANEDLIEAVEKIAGDAGIADATVRSSIGSLAGARLQTAAGRIVVAGPAVEVIHLDGTVRRDREGQPQAKLSAVLVDMDGAVHAGEVIRSENPVSLTFEITLEEWRTPFAS